MSNAEGLRRMLDERGMKYSYEHVTEGTLFVVTRDVRIYYILVREKGFKVWSDWLTPAQAVEATLGRGTCCNIAPAYLDFLCSECGFVHYHSDENDTGDGSEWHFCPNCGREVVA